MFIKILAFVCLILNCVSMYSSYTSRENVRKGCATLDDLRDLTMLMDQSAIDKKFGRPDSQGHYKTDMQTIKKHRTLMMLWEDGTDLIFLGLLISVFLVKSLVWQWSVVSLTCVIFLAQWSYAGFLVWKYRDQIDWDN